MKAFIPHLIALILVLAFLTLGSGNHTRLRTLEIEKAALLEKAASRGIDLEKTLPLSTRSRSLPQNINIEEIAREFIASGVTFQDCYQDHDFARFSKLERERAIAAVEGVISLNSQQLQTLVDLISAEVDLPDHLRQRLLTFALIERGKRNPKAVFDHVIQSETLREQLEKHGYSQVHRSIVPGWLARDPENVLGWMRDNQDQLSESMRSSLTWDFAKNLAESHPLDTFDFVHEFSDQPSKFFPGLFRDQVLTTAQKSQALSRLREMADALPEDHEKSYLAKNLQALVIGQSHLKGDFQEALAMIETNQLGAAELEFLWNPARTDLRYYIKAEETILWIPWLRETFPQKSQRRVQQLIDNLQKRDPEAAALFLKESTGP